MTSAGCFGYADDSFGLIDTTPADLPHPPEPLIETAARDVPSILAEVVPKSNHGEFSSTASLLVRSLMKKGHTRLAAHWALHRLVVEEKLLAKPAYDHLQMVSVSTEISSVQADTSQTAEPGGCWKARLIPPEGPTPFDRFRVVATPLLWEWWGVGINGGEQSTKNQVVKPEETEAAEVQAGGKLLTAVEHGAPPKQETLDLPVNQQAGDRVDEGDTIVVKTGKKKRNRTKVTDDQIEAEIRAYVARNEVAYNRFKKARAEAQPKSEQHARKMFGRNALAKAVSKAFGQRISGSRISATAAWGKIKQELLLDDAPGENHRGVKIGMGIAIEQAAEEAGDTTQRDVLDRELIVRMEKELPEDAASELISRYQLGDTNEADIEEFLIANADHKAHPFKITDSDRRRAGPRRRKRHD